MKRISLTQGQFTIVDNKNYEWLNQWKWCAAWSRSNQSFYATRSTNKNGKQRKIYMAREILGLFYSDKRKSDHINYNTLDNRESNLRAVTDQQNKWNRKNPKGYTWHKTNRKYMAQRRIDGKKMNLGYFDTTKEAHNTYLKAKKKYHKI